MTPVANQPILFSQSAPKCCFDEGLWTQKMFDTDVIRWQFELNTCPDADELITNYDFTTDTGWTKTGNATISGGAANLPSSQDSISQTTGMPEGIWLEVKIVIDESDFNVSNSKLKVTGFDASIVFTPTPGMFKFYVQSLSDYISITHTFATSQTQDSGLKIGSFSVREVAFPSAVIKDLEGNVLDSSVPAFMTAKYATWEYTPIEDVINNGVFKIEVSRTCSGNLDTWTSEQVCIIPENDCDYQLGICAQTNVYGNGFQPVVRLTGEMKKGVSYLSDRTVVETNTGKFNLGYGRRNKGFTLNIPLMPEHMRDFLYYLPMSNTIAIRKGLEDASSFFVSDDIDDPQPVDGTIDLTNISISLTRKAFLEESIFTGDCEVFLPPYVIGEREIDIAIQTDTDELIKG